MIVEYLLCDHLLSALHDAFFAILIEVRYPNYSERHEIVEVTTVKNAQNLVNHIVQFHEAILFFSDDN
jgi:hypothetical protein